MGLGVLLDRPILTLAHSARGDVGSHSSAAQLPTSWPPPPFTGVGGALLVLLAHPAAALPVLLVVLTVLAVTGALTAARTAVTDP